MAFIDCEIDITRASSKSTGDSKNCNTEMSEHNLDKMFREKLGDHQAAYNAASWAAAESMIQGKSSKGGFWLLGLLGILLCGAALCGVYNFQASTEDSIAISAQYNVLLTSRFQEMELRTSTLQNSNSTLAMLEPSINDEIKDLQVNDTSDEKQLAQALTSEKSQIESEIGFSASANDLPGKVGKTESKVKAEVPFASSASDSSGYVYVARNSSTANNAPTQNTSSPKDNILNSELQAPITGKNETAAKNDIHPEAPVKTTNHTVDYTEEEDQSQNRSHIETSNESVNSSNQTSGITALISLPPTLALYDLQSASFNASLLPVDKYSPSFWEIKFHTGYGYNARSLKPLEEGLEGYTALRDKEETIGWSPEIGFEAIYEPGRLNYSIGLNWYSIGETNNYSPATSYVTALDSSSINTSIETSYFGLDSLWIQENDSGGFFGYWEVFITEELSNESLVLYSLDSILTSIETPVDPVNERTTFQYIEIPLSIGYEFEKGPWSLGLRTGISAGLLVSTKGQYIDTDSQSAIVKQDISRRWIWNYQARIALGYALNDKTRLYLEPVFKTTLNSIVNRTDFSQKYSTYGLRLGLGFKF
ncbi:MAG: hypothetical protein ACI84C_001834 [Flavobacteriales bacterium]|jgi:hypothetical protein